MPRKKFYVSTDDLERARRVVANGEEYERRISTFCFIRFSSDALYVYWCNSTATWKRKKIAGWKTMLHDAAHDEINDALRKAPWEIWPNGDALS